VEQVEVEQVATGMAVAVVLVVIAHLLLVNQQVVVEL
jgi:hypothetical protein